MVIIAEVNSLAKGLNEACQKQLKALTAKDKFLLLCDRNATISMDILEIFMDLKVKPQFIKLDLSDKFALGYQYGQLAVTYGKEKIYVISEENRSGVLGDAMETISGKARPAAPKKKIPVKELIPVEPKAAPKKTVPKAEEKPVAKKAEKPQKPAKAPAPKKEKVQTLITVKESASAAKETPKKSRAQLKDLSNASLLKKYPALSQYADKINRLGEGTLQTAITIAQDSDISFKLQLTMYFGAEDGEAMWKVLKKDFAKLKELVK